MAEKCRLRMAEKRNETNELYPMDKGHSAREGGGGGGGGGARPPRPPSKSAHGIFCI